MQTKGKWLERQVKRLFQHYEQLGAVCEQHFPERLHDGRYVNSHGYDFSVFYKSHYYAFDAKESKKASWSFTNAKPHQLNALKRVKNNGGSALFLVYFFAEQWLCLLDVDDLLQMIKDGKKSIKAKDFDEVKIDFLGLL